MKRSVGDFCTTKYRENDIFFFLSLFVLLGFCIPSPVWALEKRKDGLEKKKRSPRTTWVKRGLLGLAHPSFSPFRTPQKLSFLTSSNFPPIMGFQSRRGYTAFPVRSSRYIFFTYFRLNPYRSPKVFVVQIEVFSPMSGSGLGC